MEGWFYWTETGVPTLTLEKTVEAADEWTRIQPWEA